MLIRTETPNDILPIDALLKEAFETEAESNLVMQLRENGKLVFSAVACDDNNEVIGHILFTQVRLDGLDYGFLGLAPLAIAKAHRKQGVAKELMKFSFESLAELGHKAIFTLGDPMVYHHANFTTASNLRCKWPVPAEYFMVKELVPNALDGMSGLIEYQAEFDVF